MMYAVIMAGGSGTRLWPKSRKSLPKQFQKLISDRSMIQETVDRLSPAIEVEQTYIIAGESHVAPITQQLTGLPKDQIIAEPCARNTAPAVGIAAVALHAKDPDAVMLVLPADHFIGKPNDFKRMLKAAESLAMEGDYLITLGIKPSYPETGYGYIEIGDEFRAIGQDKVYLVESFKEKPSLETAQEYVTSWKYVWNSGMFVWKASTIIEMFKRYAPDIYEGMERYRKAIGTPQEAEELKAVYDALPSISVDYAILEKAEQVLVMPAEIGWSDIGSWAALHDLLSEKEGDNVVIGEHVGVDTHNCLIQGQDKLIATVGLDNMIVVDSGDVILICPKGRSQDIKALLDELKKHGKGDYL